MKEVVVKKGQTIIDICIEYYGTPNAMAELHKLNGFDMMPQLLLPGDIVLVDPDSSQYTNKQMLKAIQGSSPGTYDASMDGINEMIIEADFIIN